MQKYSMTELGFSSNTHHSHLAENFYVNESSSAEGIAT